MGRRSCIVLGAGGLVGQRLQQRLVTHPFFEMKAVAGSSESAGKELSEIKWKLEQARPDLPELTIIDLSDENFIQVILEMEIDIVFSALPEDIASVIEIELADAGLTVFSNSSANQRKKSVPLVIPEVNLSHLYNTKKRIYCATNCTLLPIAIPLAALYQDIEIKNITMHSEQALSGAGWKLLSDQQALAGNHQRTIDGEAEKTSSELLYVFGELKDEEVKSANFTTDFNCQRVTRKDGHQVFVEITTKSPVTLQEIISKFTNFKMNESYYEAPSSPINPIHLVDSISTRNHLWSDGKLFSNNPRPSTNLKTGMAIIIGDVEVKDEHTIYFSAYSHNTIRGAAGGLILLAEFALMNSVI